MVLILHMESVVAQTSFYTRGQRLMKEGYVEIILVFMGPVIDYGGGGGWLDVCVGGGGG